MKNFIISALTLLVTATLLSACGVPESQADCNADPFRNDLPSEYCAGASSGGTNTCRNGYTVTPTDPDCDGYTTEDEHRYCRVWPNGKDPATDANIFPFSGDVFGDGIDSDCGGTDGNDNTWGNPGGGTSSGSSGTTSGGSTCESRCSTSCVASQNACGADGNSYCNACTAACRGTSLVSCQGTEFTLKVRHKDDPWEAYGLVETPTVLQSTTCKEYTFTATGNDQNAQLMFMVGRSNMPFRFSNVVFRQTSTSGNLARNGNFQAGTRDWVKEDHLGGMNFSASGGELLCQSGHDGAQDWQSACYTLVPVQSGVSYTLSFCARVG